MVETQHPHGDAGFGLLAVGVCVLALWAGIDLNQTIFVWNSDLTLWAHAVTVAPQKPRPHLNFGRELDVIGDLSAAEREARLARMLSFDPNRFQTQQELVREFSEINLAHILMQRKQFDAAKRMLDPIVAADPEFPLPRYNRALAERLLGQCAASEADYRQARHLDPSLIMPSEPCVSR